MTVVFPDADPAVAVISVVPVSTVVTRPEPSTAATPSLPDDQVNSAPSTGWPFSSNASAVSCSVSPRTALVASDGRTATESGTCATVTAAVPEAGSAVAVIVAVPLPVAVTRPEPSTAATAGALLDQLTVVPDITLPFWSRTSAVSCTVAPKAVRSVVAGVTVSVVAREGSGETGSLPPSPQPTAHASTTAAAKRILKKGLTASSRFATRSAPGTPSRPDPGADGNHGRGWRPMTHRLDCQGGAQPADHSAMHRRECQFNGLP